VPGVALAIAPLLFAAGATVAQDDVGRLVADLGDERDHARRNAAYRTLLRRKPPEAVPLLVKALPGWGPNAQGQGVYLLRSYPRETAVPALRRLTRSDSHFLALCSAVELHGLREPDQGDTMASALRAGDVSPSERVRMLGRLSGLTLPEVQDAVRDLLTPDAESAVFDAALYHLARSADRESRRVVAGLLDSGDLARDRAALCTATLVALGSRKHGDQLARLLTGDEPVSLPRLERYLSLCPELDEVLAEALVALAEDPASDVNTLRSVARVFGRHGGRRIARALSHLLEHDDPDVVEAALRSLGTVGAGLEVQTLRELLGAEDARVVLAAADLLRRRDDPSGLPVVLRIARGSAAHRAEAVRVLGGFRLRAAVEPLIDALADPDPRVREYAHNGLLVALRSLFPYRRIDLATVGYAVDAPAAARQEAVRRIRSWWRTVHGG
jgi:HEAT repeat protein